MKKILGAFAIVALALSLQARAQSTNSITIGIAGTGSGAISGPNCALGTHTYPAGTGIGQCVETPAAGSIFAGWTASGSIYCNGSTATTCGVYGLNSASTLLANFSAEAAPPVTPPVSPPTAASAVNLTWTASTSCITGVTCTVNVYRCLGTGCTAFAAISTSAPAGGPYADSTVPAGTTSASYYVTDTANGGGWTGQESAPSNTVTVVIAVAPVAAPTNLNATN